MMKEPFGHVATIVYDNAGALKKSLNPDGSYAIGKRLGLKIAESVTTFVNDEARHLIKILNPDGFEPIGSELDLKVTTWAELYRRGMKDTDAGGEETA